MTPFVASLDIATFYLINGQGRNYFLDWFMPFLTDLKNFYYVLALVALWIVWKERKAGIIFLIFLGLTLVLMDYFSSYFLKSWVARIRPCHVLKGVYLLTDCNTSYSFPSSHAVNIFAAAYFLSQPLRKISPLLYAISALVGYSRIYMGIHYPFDVIGGAGIGLLIAWPMRRLKDWMVEQFARIGVC